MDAPLGGYSGRSRGGSPLLGSFAKGYGQIATLFRLGSSTGGGGILLFGIVAFGCLSGVLVVRVIPSDSPFVPLGRVLVLEGPIRAWKSAWRDVQHATRIV